MHEKIQHKWSLATVLLAASGVVLVGICVYLAVAPPRLTASFAANKGYIAANTNLVDNYDVSYPVLHLPKIDAALRAYARNSIDTYEAKVKDQKNDPKNSFQLTYTILHQGEQTVTVAFTSDEKIAGQKAITSQNMMTFDVDDQGSLELTQLFKSEVEAQTAIANLLYDYFAQPGTGGLSPLEHITLLDFTLAQVKKFAVNADDLILYINPHDLTDSQNIQAISVKKALLASVLKDEYAASDGEQQSIQKVPVAFAIAVQPERRTRVDPAGKLLALTFDDGPGVHTSRLLDALKKYRAHATFFVLGSLVEPYGEMIKREVAEGHEVGNHSWRHPYLTTLPPDQLAYQIDETQNVIRKVAAGYTPRLMRPPYGAVSPAVTSFLASRGLREALWNVDTNDWLHRDAQVVYDQIKGAAADNKVMLLHDIHPTSVDGVIRALPELVAEGYQLVTLSELYAMRL